jgi:D-cysteine desulfhydrase
MPPVSQPRRTTTTPTVDFPAMDTLPRRLPLARLPTPLQPLDRLTQAWGGPTIWAKRDDLTGFGVSGNKIRKLEFHFAAAEDAGADTVITCGAAQSNHCRTTALAGAAVGLRTILVLRTPDGLAPHEPRGNLLLDHLAGAEIRYITPDDYLHRGEVMAEIADGEARNGRRPWVIPEGASDALGMWGFVQAFQELDQQLARVQRPVGVWHAASSGGTTAGLGWAADRLGVEVPIVGCSVGDTVEQLGERIRVIWAEAVAAAGGGRLPTPVLELTDDHLDGGYGLTSPDALAAQAEVTSLTGLVLDPTYTGKAIVGLADEIRAGRYGPGDDMVFWHTGGGFAVFAHDFGAVLS